MSNYKEELNNIHAPEDLILRTLNKVHAEEEKYKEEKHEEEKQITIRSKKKKQRIIITFSTLAAAAVILAISMGLGTFKSYNTDSATSKSTTRPAASSAASSAAEDAEYAAEDTQADDVDYIAEESESDDADYAAEDSASGMTMSAEDDKADNSFTYSQCDKDSHSRDTLNYGSGDIYSISGDIQVTEELNDIFNDATQDISGVAYTPVAYLGSRVDAGTELAYLCKATSEDGGKYWSMVYINEQINGEAKLAKDICIDVFGSVNDKTVQKLADTDEDLLGGWETSDEYNLPDDMKSVIEETLGEVNEVTYTPKMVMGTQVVSGTNYAILCSTNDNSSDANAYWSIVYVYINLNGEGQILNASTLSLE